MANQIDRIQDETVKRLKKALEDPTKGTLTPTSDTAPGPDHDTHSRQNDTVAQLRRFIKERAPGDTAPAPFKVVRYSDTSPDRSAGFHPRRVPLTETAPPKSSTSPEQSSERTSSQLEAAPPSTTVNHYTQAQSLEQQAPAMDRLPPKPETPDPPAPPSGEGWNKSMETGHHSPEAWEQRVKRARKLSAGRTIKKSGKS